MAQVIPLKRDQSPDPAADELELAELHLAQATVHAVARTHDLLASRNESAALGAARLILEQSHKFWERRVAQQELAELRQQLSDLRTLLEGQAAA